MAIIWQSQVNDNDFAILFDDEKEQMIRELDKAVELIVTDYLYKAGIQA